MMYCGSGELTFEIQLVDKERMEGICVDSPGWCQIRTNHIKNFAVAIHWVQEANLLTLVYLKIAF